MDRRRPRPDPLIADRVNSRLALVLAEHLPRRASGPTVLEAAAVPAAEELIVDADLPPAPFRRRHLKVVAGLLALGLVVTGWSLFRARPVAVAGPTPVVVATSTLVSPVSPGPSVSSAVSEIVVHVLGAVRKPGLVRLSNGSRVQDAIAFAGGLKGSADPGELNLAQVLTDGQQVMIGSRRAPAGEVRDGGAAQSDGGGTGGTALDLNRATSAQLEALPGVGPVTAEKIVAWRTANTRFSTVKELQEVDGIGPKTYAEIEPHVRV